MRVRYVVKDENTLGFIMPDHPHIMDVLAGNMDGHDPKNGFVSTFGHIREATEKDFEVFRVSLPNDFKNGGM